MLSAFFPRIVLRGAFVCAAAALAAGLQAQTAGKGEADEAPPGASESAAAESAVSESAPGGLERDDSRTALNLLGETDADSGESRRNENVQFNLVDNNALKELNVRLGATATIVEEFRVERGYFGAEFGAAPTPAVHASAGARAAAHGNVFWSHNNSVFSARSFFQVGDVQPARENHYGGLLGTSLWEGGYLTAQGSQNKIRGNVNGNILIPLPEERAPLAAAPELRAIVQRFIDAYPSGPPNRPDIAARAHNANSLQSIDTDSGRTQLDQSLGGRDAVTARYAFTAQNVDAFQLVKGQNPDTDTKSHSARLTWNRVWNPRTITDFSIGFDRLGSLLVAAQGAVGPVSVGRALTSLGPRPFIPIDRAQNRFRYAGTLRHAAGRRRLTAGFALARLQYNGEETEGHRGILSFRNDLGRDAITNMRLGTPSFLIQSIGTTYRGFRNWDMRFFIGGGWRAAPALSLDFGLRWEPIFKPVDVTGRSDLPYSSDLNNWSPSFGFAYRPGGGRGVLRGAYALLYGQIFPVTYGQHRLNRPHTLRVNIRTPNLDDPLAGLRFEDLDPNSRSTLIELGGDLAAPYSHQYNFSWEMRSRSDWRLQLGYVGSRSHKLFLTYFLNRGRVVAGVPLTSATVNRRRANQDVYEHLFGHNGSRAFYDAARVSLLAPQWRGLTLNAAYWFGKAIDLGGSFSNTASPQDARDAVAQTEALSQPDIRGLSNFDQPHAFLLQAGYRMPDLRRGWLRKTFGRWSLSTVTLLRSGTPFTVDSGSDGPGRGNVDGRSGDRPMLLDPSILGRTIGDPDTSAALLPRSVFRFIRAPAELAGNLGRNTFRKGKIANVNAALERTWPIVGDASATFRVEAINLFNTPQFAEPGKSLTAPNFGQINNTLNDGRTFRFTLRLRF